MSVQLADNAGTTHRIVPVHTPDMPPAVTAGWVQCRIKAGGASLSACRQTTEFLTVLIGQP